jgi:hypothetical protein
MICSSLNRLRFIVRLLSSDGLNSILEEFSGLRSLPATCSVCAQLFGERNPQLFWTTQWVGTDYVPLLIHSCSNACTDTVPSAPPGFFERPHKGGGGVGMPIA